MKIFALSVEYNPSMGSGKFEMCILPNLDKISSMAEQGADDAEIARAVGIHRQTFGSYLAKGRQADQKRKTGKDLSEKERKFLDFFDCYATAHTVPDAIVEAALFNSCRDHIVRRRVIISKEYDEKGNVVREVREEEMLVPASVPAQQFYLANKKRKDWEYKPDANKPEEGREKDTIVIVAREKLTHGSDMGTTT